MDAVVSIEKIEVEGRSDRGLVRVRNEDRWGCLAKQGFVVLADGMGGHRAGDIAAQAVVARCCTTIKRLLEGDRHLWHSLNDLCCVLRFVIKDANKYIWKLSKKNPQWKGMGSTLCCLLFYGGYVVRGHVGDSRIYRLREGSLSCLTRDDTLVRDMIDGGTLEEEEVQSHTERHVLTQALGVSPLISPTLAIDHSSPHDLYLLCSDGLTEHVPDAFLEEVLTNEENSERATQQLIDAAKAAGGVDNVTVVVVRNHERIE